jgi:Fe2+ transport system protein FeoA
MFDAASIPLFYQIALLLALAAGFGLVGVALRQPLIVSYIALGLIAGPSALGIAEAGEAVNLLAELGIAPGARVRVVAREPRGGMLRVQVGEHHHALSRDLAAMVRGAEGP